MKNKKKILFMIPSLAEGGAEKVLVNLVNNMDVDKFQITILVLFDGGVNRQFLKPWIEYRACFSHTIRGNSHLLKLVSPKRLYRHFIKEDYDVLISYLEGPTARIVSGCDNPKVKLISWIHCEQYNMKELSKSFRSENEAKSCYNRFDQTICVSQFIKNDFCRILEFKKPCGVLYNTIESEQIQRLANEDAGEIVNDETAKLVAVGTLKEVKGYGRLLKIIKDLINEGLKIHLYILGIGPLEKQIKDYICNNNLQEFVSLLGYHTNPYRIVSKCDLYICSSYSEGFSTAATEALIVGTPICTVDVSGMKEMLGDNEFGLIVDNNDEALENGIRRMVVDAKLREHYSNKAKERAGMFEKSSTVKEVEKMIEAL